MIAWARLTNAFNLTTQEDIVYINSHYDIQFIWNSAHWPFNVGNKKNVGNVQSLILKAIVDWTPTLTYFSLLVTCCYRIPIMWVKDLHIFLTYTSSLLTSHDKYNFLSKNTTNTISIIRYISSKNKLLNVFIQNFPNYLL